MIDTNAASMERVDELKTKGNVAYKSKSYDEAVVFYTEAIAIANNSHILYSNRSLACLKLKLWQNALDDANESIRCCDSFPKAWFTKAKAQVSLGDSDQAIESYVKALELDLHKHGFDVDGVDVEGMKGLTSLVLVKMTESANIDTNADGEEISDLIQRFDDIEQETEMCLRMEYFDKLQVASANALKKYIGIALDEYTVLLCLGKSFTAQTKYVLALACYWSSFSVIKNAYAIPAFVKLKSKSYALGRIGDAFCKLGKFKTAEGIVKYAISVDVKIETEYSQQLDSEFFTQKATNLRCYGMALISQGQYLRSLEILQEALKLCERYQDLRNSAIICRNMGWLYRNLGEYEEAIEWYKRGIQLSEQIGDKRGVADNWGCLALCYMCQDQFEDAIKSVKKSVEVFPSKNNKMNQYLQLGAMYSSRYMNQLGQTDLQSIAHLLNEAETYFEEGLGIATDINSSSWMLLFQGRIVYLMLRRQQPTRAEKYFTKSLAMADQTDVGNLAPLQYCLGLALLYQNCINDAIAAFTRVEKLYDQPWQELGKDRFMIAYGDAPGLSEANQMLQLAYVIAQNYEGALEVAERGRSKALVKELNQKASAFRNNAPQPLDCVLIKSCARKLGVTFVYFSLVKELDILFVWVITSDRVFFHLTLYAAKFKKNLIQNILPSTVQELPDVVAQVTRDFTTVKQRKRQENISESEAESLYLALWEVCESWLPNDPNAQVIIVPHDELFSIPFAALRRSDGKRLIDCYTLSMTPSVTWLANRTINIDRLLQRELHLPVQCFIAGNPTMPNLQELKYKFVSLPEAQREANVVAGIFNCKATWGYACTKQKAVTEMPGSLIIHIATHSIVQIGNGDSQDHGALVFAGKQGVEFDSITDSLLTAAEIQELPLADTKLVVLSGCSTGSGRLRAEGIIGLGRAFLFAGAQAVVLSLWNVPDTEHTCRFMEKFYEGYAKSGEVAASLRMAMLFLRDEVKRPINEWASFFAYGNV